MNALGHFEGPRRVNIIDPTAKPPKAPDGLQLQGRKLWHAVVDGFELWPHELPILEAAARQRDEIARMDAELRKAPTLVEGSTGQEKPNPLFAELRQHRLALAKLITHLGLDESEVAATGAGRKLARTRWSGRGRKSA